MTSGGAPGADARCLLLLTLLLLCVYLLTMSGRVISGGGETMYLTTRALVTEGSPAIVPRPESAEGRDGRWYSKYGLGQTAVQPPFFVAGHAIGKAPGALDDRAGPLRGGDGQQRGQRRPGRAVLADPCGPWAAGGGGRLRHSWSSVWPPGPGTYARADFAEPLQAFSVLLAFYALIRWRPAGPWMGHPGRPGGRLALLTKARLRRAAAPPGGVLPTPSGSGATRASGPSCGTPWRPGTPSPSAPSTQRGSTWLASGA